MKTPQELMVMKVRDLEAYKQELLLRVEQAERSRHADIGNILFLQNKLVDLEKPIA